MWWIVAVASIALLACLLISVFPQHPGRRARLHDFERATDPEHLYKY